MTRPIFAVLLLLAGQIQAADGIERFSWLAGCWRQTDAEPGSIEQWTAPAGGSMLGLSRTIRNGRTTTYEFLQIREVEPGVWAYLPQPNGRAPTIFKLQSASDMELVFENPEHDFPQRIIYRRDGDNALRARIEGQSKGVLKGIDFPLQRTSCQ